MAAKVTVSSARTVETLLKPGRHNAGDNLYLVNDLKRTKSGETLHRYWVVIYSLNGRRREMGLGSVSLLSLAEARKKALDARKLLNEGTDPLEARQAAKRTKMAIPTFGEFADEYIKAHRPKFKNDKHAAQWAMTLGDAYCKTLRSKPINTVDTESILKVLQPVWTDVPETASRIRGRLENVLDAAKARGFYQGENPAKWKGHLKAILPARQRLARGHHAALPYDDLPSFITKLRQRQSTAALALELCILTASRSSEVLNATWDEFELSKKIWIIPAARMKAGYEHRIPLSSRAISILNELVPLESNTHVFCGNKRGKPLSSMAMAMQLRRLGRDDITVHGFRSTFRDWAAEQTSFPHETCEHALAHRISDKADASYRRGDQIEKRQKLMEAWAEFCGTPSGGLPHKQAADFTK